MRRLICSLSLTFAVAAGPALAGETAITAKDWKPDDTQAQQAMTALKIYLARPNNPSQWSDGTPETQVEKQERATVLKRLETYSIRIMGEIGRPQPALSAKVAGRKLIAIGGFCMTEDEHWKTPGYLVFDGGVCYFNAEYDPETRTIVHFAVNGAA